MTEIGIIGDHGWNSDIILFPIHPKYAKWEIEEFNLQTESIGPDKVIFFKVITREEFFKEVEKNASSD